MIRKSLHLPIVIAILSIVIFNVSEFTNAATAPTATPLGYNTLSRGTPARITTDSAGRYYVTDAHNNAVKVFSNNGVLLLTVNVNKPAGIYVDQSGSIFVGSTYDGSVSVFDSQGSFLYKLGSGNGEFGLANDIAISSSGTVYVTDSRRNVVKAYNRSGVFLFSFGSSAGLTFPTGIAIDDSAGEVYVSDHNNNLVKVFDLNGVYKRNIGSSSKFIRPQGIAIDSTRIYIADAYDSTIVVYGKNGTFLKYMGNYGANAGEYKTPLDVAIDKDNKLFVTNYNNSRVEIIGIDNYTQLNVNPTTLSFSVYENGSPATQTVNVTSTGNAANWVVSTSESWVSVSPSSGTTPSDGNITVNPAGLSAGNYTTQVMFSTTSGTSVTVQVNLEVKSNPKILYVSPSSMSFKYQQESPVLPSGDIILTSTGGNVSWTASASTSWISLNSASGITPSSIKLNITNAVNTLSPGTYNASVVINGGSAQGSPATIDVSLNLIYAGTLKVTTNLEQAGFEITPIGIGASYSGTGKEWSNDEVTPGDYTITFKHISGYIKPATRTFTIKTGQETVIDGQYRTKPVATHIIAGSGGTQGKSVVVLTLDGTQQIASFEPFNGPVSLRVAAGDLDGSGTDKIVVTDHKKSIKVYTSEGTELASSEMAEWYTKSVIGVADIDNDGKAEIIVGVKNDYDTVNIQREIKLFRYNNGTLEENDKLYTENKDKEFRIALGDTNGDGIAELLLADENTVRSFSIDLLAASGNKLTEIWSKDTGYKETPEIAAGDINDDGIAEIALSISTDTNTGASSSRKRSKDTGSGGNTNTNNGNTNNGNTNNGNTNNGNTNNGNGNTNTNNGNTNTDNGNTNTGNGNTDTGNGNKDTGNGNGNTNTDNGNTDTGSGGKGKDETSMIKILKGTGEDYGLVIDAYGDLGYEKPSTVVLGDIDGDGIDEIAAGAGRDEKNEALIRTFESDGTFTGTTIKAMDSKFGVNVSLGRFK